MSNATPAARFIARLIADLLSRAAAETCPVQRARLLKAVEHYENNEAVCRGGR